MICGIMCKGGFLMPENRGLKNRTAISTAIDKELWVKLKTYSEKTDIPASKLLDKAIAAFLESLEKGRE